MSTNIIPLSEVVSVEVSLTPTGLPSYNVNNMILITSDPFLSNPNGDLIRNYSDSITVGSDFGTNTETCQQSEAVFAQQNNILAGGGVLYIAPFLTGETLAQAIARCRTYAYFNGIISTNYGDPSTFVALAASVQALGNGCIALPTASVADLSGALLNVQLASLNKGRGLYYGSSALDARLFAASYMSFALSTNYNGSNTTITMNLKQLQGIGPDPTLTSAIRSLCKTAGVDCYGYFGGSYPGCISNGNNKYMDEITNEIWLAMTFQVESFDALAEVGTKIPQTDAGISILKSVDRLVMTQAVANGYIAPGQWPSSYTFGNQSDFLSNILQYGFYIYAAPIAQQLASIKAGRVSPTIQIAALQAGAVHSVPIIVNIMP
jgi:hypothetical protein